MVFFQNECSFVSLRDVERAMKVITWFYSNSELILRVIKAKVNVTEDSSEEESDEDEIGNSSENESDEDSYDEVQVSSTSNFHQIDHFTFMPKVKKKLRTTDFLPITVTTFPVKEN